MQMVRSEGQAIRCLVIHSVPTWRGKPRLVCMYLPVSASVQLEQSSSLAPAKLPYLAPVGPRYLGAGCPTQVSGACPVLLNRSSVGWEAAPTSRRNPADAMRRSNSSSRRSHVAGWQKDDAIHI